MTVNVHQIRFAESKIPPPKSQVATPVVDDSNSFDPSAHVKVVDEREAAVIAEYIGLTIAEGYALRRYIYAADHPCERPIH